MQIISTWQDRAPWPMWVYPSEGRFVAPDDYFTLAAYRQSGVDQAGCLVLGVPNGGGVTVVRGPLSVNEVKQSLGIE